MIFSFLVMFYPFNYLRLNYSILEGDFNSLKNVITNTDAKCHPERCRLTLNVILSADTKCHPER